MVIGTIEPDAFARWVPVRAAITKLRDVMAVSQVEAELLNRAKSGVVSAASTSSASTVNGKTTSKLSPSIILVDDWDHFSWEASNFAAGSVVFLTRVRNSNSAYGFSEVSTSHFSLRLNPEHLAREFPDLVWVDPPATAPADDTDEPDNRPFAPEANIQRWVAAFNSVYPNATEEFAMKSARGFFQGNRITREAVRKVLPERRPGRPTVTRPVG